MSFAFAEEIASEAAEQVAEAAEAATKRMTLDMGNNLLYAILGYLVVFVGLTLLMAVIIIVGKIMVAKVPEAPKQLAPGSAGDVKLYDTDPRDAAMIMAIVADKLQKPLNELRFVSIKEVK